MSTMNRTGWALVVSITVLALRGATACSSSSSPASPAPDAATESDGQETTDTGTETPATDGGSEATMAAEAGGSAEGGQAEGGNTEGGSSDGGSGNG